jgi:hypothetical protein
MGQGHEGIHHPFGQKYDANRCSQGLHLQGGRNDAGLNSITIQRPATRDRVDTSSRQHDHDDVFGLGRAAQPQRTSSPRLRRSGDQQLVGGIDPPEGFGVAPHVRVVDLHQTPMGRLHGGLGGAPGELKDG